MQRSAARSLLLSDVLGVLRGLAMVLESGDGLSGAAVAVDTASLPAPIAAQPVAPATTDVAIADPSASSADGVSGGSATVMVVEPAAPTDAAITASSLSNPVASVDAATTPSSQRFRERRVPTSATSRAIGFGGLAVGLAAGAVGELARRALGRPPERESGPGLNSVLSPLLSDANADRIAETLCRMRGAALKVGQLLSIQDENLVPAPLVRALERARQGADAMPRAQLERVLRTELGDDWRARLRDFDFAPFAAASIGQVHRAVTLDGDLVAMKIQYPGVAKSIDSDLRNLKRLLTLTGFVPRGMYLDEALTVAREELSRECDYRLELANQQRFYELLQHERDFRVPRVYPELSTRGVLTSELVSGVPVDKLFGADAALRNRVATLLLRITMRELFEFRFMQTDPNFSNFLYDTRDGAMRLLDFGAARPFRKAFVDEYLRLVVACARRDRPAVLEHSRTLGFLTGVEDHIMLDAHVNAAFVVGEPFAERRPYDFRAANIAGRVAQFGRVMLDRRLTAPPIEVYSLHRRLSGAFMICVKLGAVIPSYEVLEQVVANYRFGPETA